MSEERKGVAASVADTVAGFREFLMRGNVVELAVAVVIGTAFTAIVNSVVQGVISPLVGAFGTKNLAAYESCLRGPCESNEAGEVVQGIPIRWGSVLSASLTFLITAAVVYFIMILPMSRYLARRQAKAPAERPAPTELDVLMEIRDELMARRGASESESVAAAVGAQRTGPDAGPEPPDGEAPGPGRRGDGQALPGR